MTDFGLIGHPLFHSYSKMYFELKFAKLNLFRHRYNLFDLKNFEELKAFKESPRLLKGLNVTIPYKETILTLLDDISPEAQLIGAVNSISIKNNLWKGYNTDVYGFEKSLSSLAFNQNKQILILGTGGASKAVQYVLKNKNLVFTVVSRQPNNEQIAYSDLDKKLLENVSLIINTSPVGMYPKIDTLPQLPFELISPGTVFYDLIYNPEKTEFLKKGESIGCNTKNGYEMFKHQADKSWEIWNQNL